jgi:Mn-dependent DtxR family transcriptional regulator
VTHETAMRGASIAIALAFGLSACASNPLPNEKLASARESLARAEQSGAVELAPGEMTVARDKLERAERAAAKHDGKLATGLADEARVDADLAEAEAQEIKSHKAEVELEASLAALRRESSTPPPPLVPVPQSPPPRSPQ